MGTTARFFLLRSRNFPLVNALRWTSSRERSEEFGSPDSTSWVMNHSGNWKQSMPVEGTVGSSVAGGGAKSRIDGSPEAIASLSVSRVSTISSPPFDQ